MMKSFTYKIKKSPFRYFLLKLALLLAIVFALDFSIGNILSYYYFKQESGMQYRTTYSIEETTADILIFGSSRANHHYNPDVFEKRLNQTFYNVGRDGNFILYHSAVLQGVLKRYSPKMVILDFIGGEFQKVPDSYDRLSSLLPYYRNHPEMRSTIELKSKLEKLKMLSYIYPYNSSMLTIAIGNTEYNKKRRGDIQGYVPLEKVFNGTIHTVNNPTRYEIDTIKVKAFEAFIQNCIQSNVELYIVCSPYFIKTNDQDYSVRIAQEIAKKNNIKFFDYSKDSVFLNNSSLFADVSHLNESGAKVFSNILIDNISETIESEPRKTLTSLSTSKSGIN